MKNEKTITSKLNGETEQQYTAWLLYCEYGSLDKLLKAWEGIALKHTEAAPEMTGLIERLGKPPCRRSLADWSKKYHWVKGREFKIAEDLEILREKTKKIKREKIYKIAEIFERIINKVLKGLRGDYEPTIAELKIVWEMFQIELGKPTTRAQLNTEPEQRLPTPEEKEHGKRVHLAVKWYLENELDDEEKWQEFQKNIVKTGKKT